MSELFIFWVVQLRASVAAYHDLLKAAKEYRESMERSSNASTAFAIALEQCARVKGATESANSLLLGSGLCFMIGNSHQVLVSPYSNYRLAARADALNRARHYYDLSNYPYSLRTRNTSQSSPSATTSTKYSSPNGQRQFDRRSTRI